MKRWLKKYLVRKGWYTSLRYSFLFKGYQLLCKPEIAQAHRREVDFYHSFLERTALVFDIGAYDGHKTEAFLTFSQAVVCCEPDKKNLEILRARFKSKKKRVQIEPVAVSDTSGFLNYYVHHAGSAFNTISPQWKALLESDQQEKWNETIRFSDIRRVESTTLDALIEKYGLPSFIKIDVEGAESRVLAGLSSAVESLSFESLWPLYETQLEGCLQQLSELDTNYRYNIAVDEKLVLPVFVSAGEILDHLRHSNITHLEIIAKLNKLPQPTS